MWLAILCIIIYNKSSINKILQNLFKTFDYSGKIRTLDNGYVKLNLGKILKSVVLERYHWARYVESFLKISHVKQTLSSSLIVSLRSEMCKLLFSHLEQTLSPISFC